MDYNRISYGTLKPCLAILDVFIAFFLVMLILLTIIGNVLIVLSVVVYKRMRTFTNLLLTSLATADLLVGLIVMPLSLLDLLYEHRWPLGKLLCGVWATSDVLLCTASILNLCAISLDRYMAITSPLKYTRTRSRGMAVGLLSSVWILSFIVCTPPWIVPGWNIFEQSKQQQLSKNVSADSSESFQCAYSLSVPYRIYSALGSFYIPLAVMLSVYFKIFRVASERENLMRNSVGIWRLSKRCKGGQGNNYNYLRTASAPHAHIRNRQQGSLGQVTTATKPFSYRSATAYEESTDNDKEKMYVELHTERTTVEDGPETSSAEASSNSNQNRVLNREYHSLADIAQQAESKNKKNARDNLVTEEVIIRKLEKTEDLVTTSMDESVRTRYHPNNLLQKAYEHYQINGPGKTTRGSKEKMVYLRERKALKTIGIVVLGFIVCWMPFFVLYLIEVFTPSINESRWFTIINEVFLWLGYSNSVLNPIIYTMYNSDFRRCFRDLLSFGCMNNHRRTMSVKKLHQQSTMF
ncbi:unnamed protein product [Auanema sp. JU1783]|nr:unnamed protein product [Auanema sp. JU1783]